MPILSQLGADMCHIWGRILSDREAAFLFGVARVKTCSKCGQAKPESDFYRDRNRLKAECKACSRARARAYKQAHVASNGTREGKNARQRAYYQRHRGESKAYQVAYRKAHHDKVKDYAGFYREAHRDELRTNQRDYNTEHRAEQAAYAKAWRKQHRERLPIQSAIKRARKRMAGGTFTSRQWCALKEQYGHACLCCGRKEPKVKLTPDHVIPLARGGSNSIGNIQPLCLSCNVRKNANTIDYRPAWQGEGLRQLALFESEDLP